MFEHPDFDRYDHSPPRTGGFAFVGGGPAMLEAVVKRLGVPLAFQPYGMTEVNVIRGYYRRPDETRRPSPRTAGSAPATLPSRTVTATRS